jgi:hypothetical protein
MNNIDNSNLTLLTESELIENEGGLISLVISAAGLTIAAIYYAGYAYGKLTCGC